MRSGTAIFQHQHHFLFQHHFQHQHQHNSLQNRTDLLCLHGNSNQVDYLGLGGRDYIGTPKQPTLTLCVPEGDRLTRQIQ